MIDLGLTYEQAAHGVQSAIRYVMTQEGHPDSGPTVDMLKHLRVGVDCRAADTLGLVELLIAKGVFTSEEYIEHMRLAMNQELHMHERHCRDTYGLPANVEFR